MAYLHQMKRQPTRSNHLAVAVTLLALITGVGMWRVARLEKQVTALQQGAR